MKGKPGRHAPAFVLLELAKGPNYGLQILNQLKENLAVCRLDSAAIYRALNLLEENGLIESHSETQENGVAKHFYTITESGKKELENFYMDIQLRMKNLEYFMTSYESMEGLL